ncbi:MAG: spore coat protein U domain-containing protein [Sphingomonas sp.]|jgi:spore coat protein U-like protein|nr:spore coat protein U domain-containing protein [Sphingomonas sp.]
MNPPFGIGAALCLGSLAAPAAAVCTVTPQGVSFGSYDPLSATALDSAGNVNVTCDVLTSFTVSLSAGSSGSFAERRMTAGTTYLAYNLYIDLLRTIVWGEGLLNSNVTATGTNVDLPVYGRMSALQNVSANTYADALTVTVTY